MGELDQWFEQSGELQQEIDFRRYQLANPYRETDENIGGGKGSLTADATERLVEIYEHDAYLQNLLKRQKACLYAKQRMDAEQLDLWQMRYASMNFYSWAEVAKKIPCSVGTIYRKRYALLSLFAQELGWLPK